MVLTGISPVNNYVRHIFMCLFAICTFLMKFLFKCFALYFFSMGLFFFLSIHFWVVFFKMYPGYKSLTVDHIYGSVSAFSSLFLWSICPILSSTLHCFVCYSFLVRLKIGERESFQLILLVQRTVLHSVKHQYSSQLLYVKHIHLL